MWLDCVQFPISFMLAPVAKEGDPILPVRITTDTSSFYCSSSSWFDTSIIKGVVKNISFVGGVISRMATFLSA